MITMREFVTSETDDDQTVGNGSSDFPRSGIYELIEAAPRLDGSVRR